MGPRIQLCLNKGNDHHAWDQEYTCVWIRAMIILHGTKNTPVFEYGQWSSCMGPRIHLCLNKGSGHLTWDNVLYPSWNKCHCYITQDKVLYPSWNKNNCSVIFNTNSLLGSARTRMIRAFWNWYGHIVMWCRCVMWINVFPVTFKDHLVIFDAKSCCSPPSPKGRSGTIVFASVTCLFVRSFDTLPFLDSHSWTKPHRILRFGTMIDPMKTLLGIVCQLPSPIFDLVIT